MEGKGVTAQGILTEGEFMTILSMASVQQITEQALSKVKQESDSSGKPL